ncbi:hypothetical protein CASFOL_027397 [Castilleja foliolosa]|uniref:Uncharacterized protein n=1 Tax=Castilleja foliolosa TaxID=1961234 RepID=A0ABD3CG86_9LAMI
MDYFYVEAIKFCNNVNGISHFLVESIKFCNSLKKKIDHHGLSAGKIKRRMVGIPVYKVSNYEERDALLVTDEVTKAVSFYFISKPDALDFFDKIKLLENFIIDWRVFDTPLSNIIDEGGDEGVAVRLVPESSQIKNAIEEKGRETGTPDNIFAGVPVFMSSNLTLHLIETGERFRPAYLRKEDLQERLTAMGVSSSTIKVSSLEETIHEMKDSSTSKSNDILFIGHGGTSYIMGTIYWLHET